ncbi:MAG: DUF167 domain-containing protein [Alphaproteobacteria bacterium]|jgi:uncharacterized protein (TIGR00251 family)|nr:DUF167 domain-containing protein [Alphaproteobacteria bacterium]QQS58253.1 MAG: DUF167 domain-containing protein [Alphaproteobacteria bacterium]
MARITVKLTPGARKNEVAGWETDAAGARFLRVSVTAAPEKGKANAALVKLLAKHWGIPKSAITLVRGETSRVKVIEVQGLSVE